MLADYVRALAHLLSLPHAFSFSSFQPTSSTILSLYLTAHQLLSQELVYYDIDKIKLQSTNKHQQKGPEKAIELRQLTHEVRSMRTESSHCIPCMVIKTSWNPAYLVFPGNTKLFMKESNLLPGGFLSGDSIPLLQYRELYWTGHPWSSTIVTLATCTGLN